MSALAPSLVASRSWAQPIDPYGPPPAAPATPPAPTPPAAAPVDPYGAPPASPASPAPPAPPPATPPSTPPVDDVDVAVATALLDRARALVAAGDRVNARLLATEAAARGGDRPVGDEARSLVAELDRALAPIEPPPAPPPVEIVPPPPPPLEDLDGPPRLPAPATGRSPRLLGAYGAVGGAALGVALAGTEGDQTLVAALGGAAIGGLGGFYVARSQRWTPARAHVVGAGVLWGAVAGGAFADVVTGVEGTTEDDVAVGTALGAIGGALVGSLGSRDPALTSDDAALIHSVSLWGLVAGFTTGVAIDPPEGEAYSLNAAIGVAAGQVVGHIAARRAEVSGRRLLRINGLALLGAGVPLLLWQATENDGDVTVGSRRPWGLLATAGLVGGAYLGFRWTRGMEAGAASSDAPAAIFGRGSDGRWAAGGLSLTPARHGRGAAVTLISARW